MPEHFVISQIETDKREFLPLLLIGDESEKMIYRYIERGVLFAGFVNDAPIAVCVVTDGGNNDVEIKNLAVHPDYRKRGFGRAMIRHVEKLNPGKTITLGTGETPSTLRFYRSLGFVFSHRVPDFFTDNYDTPIIEEGVRLKDMIYLKKRICDNSAESRTDTTGNRLSP